MTGQIEYVPLSDISLDARNPRLGRAARDRKLSPEQIYELMGDWSLEELATSFLESGFWSHEAVLCIEEELNGKTRLVVVEGNRRIAALMCLERTFDGVETSRKWLDLIQDFSRPAELFSKVPVIRLESRHEVVAFLGFRHVTGIKEWAPPEKAEFIAKLIDENNLTYREVMRKIGSRTETVERNYIAFCILRQMEEIEDLETQSVEKRFSVLFLSLRNRSVQRFLGVDVKFGLTPEKVRPPVDIDHMVHLREYATWLFGNSETPPIVTDSRYVDRFGQVLASNVALEYMRSVKRPDLNRAYVISGGNEEDVHELLSTATYSVEQALSTIHLYTKNSRITTISARLVAAADQVRRTLGLT